MNLTTFKASLSDTTPPPAANVYLQALWHEAKGNWDKAHELIQDLPDKNAAWIHAYLHRQEGDTWNADYWYRRAGRKRLQQTLAEEWESITSALLEEV
ncbi:hypothetical protein [Pontibacter chinhatensis]|uniref:Uncharacterized protein n=1 Tax=Pontibacter chinhatensis TaxID=1436961 RepID=A0A1I2ZK45_9BACT|nr:hypothetical protein [Pontibacter chinhatensis]SFH38227.1 hypothetical protein SAMN05421739_11513 [Pontibacter chinhatensis]